MPSSDYTEFLRAVNRYLHEAERHARNERRRKWALIVGTVFMGVWAVLMLLSLP